MAWPGTKLMLLGTGVTVWVTSCLLVMYRSSGGQWVEFVAEQPGLVFGHSVGLHNARRQLSRSDDPHEGQLLLFALSLQGVHCK